ncbi:hypothetical protein GGR56DRAFT_70142 [Xylariaceae sp. FL0804]|nr:hypothetical protein GGR56DRAFT_70142 [Xylariaceae sp. FL0804]
MVSRDRRPSPSWSQASDSRGEKSINQGDIPERGAQVRQMGRIFKSAKTVVIWLGPDNEAGQARVAFQAMRQITDFLCDRLGIQPERLLSEDQIYHEIIFKGRGSIPLLHECDFVSDEALQALLWLYKHAYFTRVWVIQEINANRSRVAHCGHETVQWEAVELVAGYIILESSFSRSRGFGDAYCWWASTAPSELTQAGNWLHMLYLASTFSATDPRDVIYGLRPMMDCAEGGELLDPDYGKTTVEAYRDSVEAALINYKTTNALLYVSGAEDPSWVPRWDVPMYFRNPFRFGKPLPWRPAGETQAIWSIDRDSNLLTLTGFNLDVVEFTETYYETYFGNDMVASPDSKAELERAWSRLLEIAAKAFPTPLSSQVLTACADSFSFGLDETCRPADETVLFHNFVAYLRSVLDNETYGRYISPETTEDCRDGIGQAFGKPVWDFEYPVSSFFITKDKLVGCCIASVAVGDIVFVPTGSVYPLILRKRNDRYRIRGFCYVHGIMQGDKKDSSRLSVSIE